MLSMDQSAVNLAHILLSLKEVEGGEKNAMETSISRTYFFVMLEMFFSNISTTDSRPVHSVPWTNRLAEESNVTQTRNNPQQPPVQIPSTSRVNDDAHQNKKMKVSMFENASRAAQLAQTRVQQAMNPPSKDTKMRLPQPIIISSNSTDSSSQDSGNGTDKVKIVTACIVRGNYRCSRCGQPKVIKFSHPDYAIF
jgi:hypothetical protein